MAKQCETCGQSYPDEQPSCPRCAQAAAAAPPVVVNGVHKDSHAPPALSGAAGEAPCVFDPEIDLGSPVTASQAGPSGPPSGASFHSWADLLPPTPKLAPSDQTPVRFEPRSGGSLRKPENEAATPAPRGEAEIDLDEPVATPNPESGPISGASAASWTSLLRKQKEARPPEEAPVEFGELPAGTRLPEFPEPSAAPRGPRQAVRTARGLMETPSQQASSAAQAAVPANRVWLSGVMLGALLALVACLTLWIVGVEPPKAWRLQLRHWLGVEAPPTAPHDSSSNP
jgi:hypothetical protein